MTESIVDLSISPVVFFKEKVLDAASKQKVTISENVEFYLVNLLSNFINPDYTADLNQKMSAPLAFQLKDALEASNKEKQTKIYKGLGDTTLYIAGYFQDFFNKKIYDVDYYISLGSTAFLKLAAIDNERHTETYIELSESFPKLVEVVAEVSDSLGNKSSNLLATYDRWTRQQDSKRLRKQLEESGILPVNASMKIAQ